MILEKDHDFAVLLWQIARTSSSSVRKPRAAPQLIAIRRELKRESAGGRPA